MSITRGVISECRVAQWFKECQIAECSRGVRSQGGRIGLDLTVLRCSRGTSVIAECIRPFRERLRWTCRLRSFGVRRVLRWSQSASSLSEFGFGEAVDADDLVSVELTEQAVRLRWSCRSGWFWWSVVAVEAGVRSVQLSSLFVISCLLFVCNQFGSCCAWVCR